jgi:hypothetical protein
MTMLGAITRKVEQTTHGCADDLKIRVAVRATIAALIEREPSTAMMYQAGIVLGEEIKNNPGARPGDWFVAQWRAALTAILDETNG